MFRVILAHFVGGDLKSLTVSLEMIKILAATKKCVLEITKSSIGRWGSSSGCVGLEKYYFIDITHKFT